jgi:hypothetical protein
VWAMLAPEGERWRTDRESLRGGLHSIAPRVPETGSGEDGTSMTVVTGFAPHTRWQSCRSSAYNRPA